ncbi:nucleotidyltransferase family protein [Salidesulfovibrio onnuriiensis]|uniref:nucleotidyltransferase family protein n=1 Tax=Salidesulfovibrio onnuriiensis TaxID=2583823 RepID=UPI0011CA08A5|nr:nucleotidyltransferase family protein [Salidesulfovibrio onnuriiensis]
MKQVAGVILAAGMASRMGDNKLLLSVRGKAVVRNVVEAACASRLSPVIAVLGRDAEAVRPEVSLDSVTVVENPQYYLGYAESLNKGLEAVPASCAGAMFLLGDQPLLQPATIDALVEAFLEDPRRWVAPEYHGTRGNPVIVPRTWFGKIQSLHGDTGPREFINDPQAQLNLVPVEDEGVLLDVDTPADYIKVRKMG